MDARNGPVRTIQRLRPVLGLLALVLLFGALAGAARADVSNITVDPSTTNAAGGRTTYVINFQTSATGELSDNDRITITFPAGTDLTTMRGANLGDLGGCRATSATVLECSVASQFTPVSGGTTIKVLVAGVTNPGAGSQTLKVRTTAPPDSMDVQSPPYEIVPPDPVTDVAV